MSSKLCKCIFHFASKFVFLASEYSANTTCVALFNQPKLPPNLKKLRRF